VFDRKEYMKKYWAEHVEERRIIQKRWRDKNKDKVSESNRKQYLRRKELIEKGKLYEDGRSKTES